MHTASAVTHAHAMSDANYRRATYDDIDPTYFLRSELHYPGEYQPNVWLPSCFLFAALGLVVVAFVSRRGGNGGRFTGGS